MASRKNQLPKKAIDEATGGKKVRQGQGKKTKSGAPSKGRENKISSVIEKGRKDGGMKNPRRSQTGELLEKDALVAQLMATLGMSPSGPPTPTAMGENMDYVAPPRSGIPLDQRMRNAGTVPSTNVEDVRGQVLDTILQGQASQAGPVVNAPQSEHSAETMQEMLPQATDIFIERYGHEPASDQDMANIDKIIWELLEGAE